MKATLLALFVGLLMVGCAASSSKDGEKVDSSHSSTGSDDLDSIDLSGFNLDDNASSSTPLDLDDEWDRFREEVFSLTQKVKDSPSLESYGEWLKKVRLAEENFSQNFLEALAENIDESNSLIHKYKSKAKEEDKPAKQRQRYSRLAEHFSECVAERKNLKLLIEQSSKRMNEFLDLIEQDIEYVSDLIIYGRENRNFTRRTAIMKTTKIIQLDIESFLSDPENRETLAAERQKIDELYRPRSITDKFDKIAKEFDVLLLEGNKTKE